MLRQLLKEELCSEAAQLEKINAYIGANPEVFLAAAKRGFYYYLKDKDGTVSKRRYIRRTDTATLRHVTSFRFLEAKAKLLEHNISVLENALKNAVDYDDNAILAALPKSYASAIELMRRGLEDQVFQSENPIRREDLTLTTSAGVKVRSKGELALFETLNGYELKIFYEKKLVLIERELQPDGKVLEKKVEVYPDFTIVLPDGTEIYWELCGMFDKPAYREQQFKKFKLYYDNGIYMPKNLIVTMEDKDKPLDVQAIRRIIESQILPLI